MTSRRASSAAVAVELALALFRLHARLRLESREAESGWSHGQLSALFRLMTEGPRTVSHLARAEHVRQQSMTETVATLKERGVVVAAPHPRDGRKLLVSATPRAQQVVSKIVFVRDEWLTFAIGEVVDEDDAAALVKAAGLITRLADLDFDHHTDDD